MPVELSLKNINDKSVRKKLSDQRAQLIQGKQLLREGSEQADAITAAVHNAELFATVNDVLREGATVFDKLEQCDRAYQDLVEQQDFFAEDVQRLVGKTLAKLQGNINAIHEGEVALFADPAFNRRLIIQFYQDYGETLVQNIMDAKNRAREIGIAYDRLSGEYPEISLYLKNIIKSIQFSMDEYQEQLHHSSAKDRVNLIFDNLLALIPKFDGKDDGFEPIAKAISAALVRERHAFVDKIKKERNKFLDAIGQTEVLFQQNLLPGLVNLEQRADISGDIVFEIEEQKIQHLKFCDERILSLDERRQSLYPIIRQLQGLLAVSDELIEEHLGIVDLPDHEADFPHDVYEPFVNASNYNDLLKRLSIFVKSQYKYYFSTPVYGVAFELFCDKLLRREKDQGNHVAYCALEENNMRERLVVDIHKAIEDLNRKRRLEIKGLIARLSAIKDSLNAWVQEKFFLAIQNRYLESEVAGVIYNHVGSAVDELNNAIAEMEQYAGQFSVEYINDKKAIVIPRFLSKDYSNYYSDEKLAKIEHDAKTHIRYSIEMAKPKNQLLQFQQQANKLQPLEKTLWDKHKIKFIFAGAALWFVSSFVGLSFATALGGFTAFLVVGSIYASISLPILFLMSKGAVSLKQLKNKKHAANVEQDPQPTPPAEDDDHWVCFDGFDDMPERKVENRKVEIPKAAPGEKHTAKSNPIVRMI